MKELAINLMRFRKINGQTQQVVAEAAGISRVAYRNIEKGESTPRKSTLDALAKVLNISVMQLLEPLPRLKSLRLRANSERTTQEIAQSEQLILRVAHWLSDFNDLEALLEKKDNFALPKINALSPPEVVAENIREEWLGSQSKKDCISNLCELLENAGIKLFLDDFKLNSFFGLSVGFADGGPAIAINTRKNISVERQIFSMAHELGHLLLHEESYENSTQSISNDDQEHEADRFAAAFLMPQAAFVEEWNENRGLHWIDAVLKTKRHFKVSYQMILHQLVDMGKAKSPDIYKKFRADYEIRYGKKLHWKEEPKLQIGDEPYQLDPLDLMEDRLGSLVRDALDQEYITTSRAAEILNIGIEEMRERISSWKIVQ